MSSADREAFGSHQVAGPDPETTIAQLRPITSIVRETLGEDLLGAYLFGSSVLGGLRPSSDIDVLAVVRRPTTLHKKRAVIARLLPISGPGDPTGVSRSIELTVVVQPDVRPWRYPPPLDLQYGDWWRREFERGEIQPWASPNPDVAVLLEMVLRANHPLYGPPPAELLDPIPPADLRRAMLDGIPSLLADLDGDEANVILTFARTWTTLATGVIRPKDEAADWALPRLPAEHRAVIEHARAIYLGLAPEEWADLRPRVRPYLDHVCEEILRLETSGLADDGRV